MVTVLGAVTDERGASIDGARVFLGGGRPRTSRVDNGADATVRLQPGAYTIEICRGGQPPTKQKLVVGTQPQTVEVKVQ